MIRIGAIAALAAMGLAAGSPTEAAPRSKPAQVERGRYLATQLAGCAHCHAGADGRLTGRSMGVTAEEKRAGLAEDSAPIAGLPAGRTQADVSYLLQHAAWPEGVRPRPPMPHYTIHKDDADAIAAYLESLKR